MGEVAHWKSLQASECEPPRIHHARTGYRKRVAALLA
jgi:hypothetical protein